GVWENEVAKVGGIIDDRAHLRQVFGADQLRDMISNGCLIGEGDEQRTVVAQHLVADLLAKGSRMPGAPQAERAHEPAALTPRNRRFGHELDDVGRLSPTNARSCSAVVRCARTPPPSSDRSEE